MAYGFIVEKTIAADNLDVLNINAIAAKGTNVDGGTAVVLGTYNKGQYTVTVAGAAAAAGVGIAYNPTEHLTEVNGKYFAGLSADPRDYTNIGGRPFDVFIPKKGDIIGFTAANFADGKLPSTTNKNITTAANGVWTAGAEAIAAGKVAFELLEIENLPFPQAGVGFENAQLYVCVCTNN